MLLSFDLMLIGIFTIIFIVIQILVGIRIILKFFTYKKVLFIQIGIGWIGASTVWIGVAVDFISVLLFNTPTPIQVHLLIIGGVLPFTQLCWIAAITNLIEIKKSTRKLMLTIGIIIACIFAPIYIYISMTNPLVWGEKITPIQLKLSFLNQIHYAIEIIIFIVPGLWFSKVSMASNQPDINLKGKILLSTFLISIIMTLLELLSSGLLMYLIARVIAVLVAILFYIGFMIPNRVKNLILKNQ